MTPERQEQIELIYHAALELDDSERTPFIVSACGGEGALVHEVTTLVAAFLHYSNFLDESAAELGLAVLGEEEEEKDVLLSGQTIGSYRIKEKLGGGGMGEVYFADDLRLDREVALKFLTSSFLDDNWARRQLVQEARAVAMLDHANICRVYGFEEIEGYRFIVMQYIKGRSVSGLIREKLIERHEVMPMACQIVDAIAAAHEHGIIHRDIKPGNIMLTDTGQVKVLDFGLAKIVNDKNRAEGKQDVSQVTRDGMILGTVAYMSPEQLKAEKLDFRSDIFSLGTVLFELSTGQHPFQRKSNAETISAILESRDLPAFLDGPKPSGSLRRVIKRCLEKEKEDRYQSAAEVLLDLQASYRPVSDARLAASWLILLLVVFLGAAAAFLSFRTGGVYKVAILPFANESSDVGLDYIRDGVPESLSKGVSEFGGYEIIPYSKLSGYREPEPDLARIGRDADADLVVSGRIIRQGDALVVTAKLIDAKEGTIVRIAEHPFDIGDLRAVEGELVRKLFSGLEVQARAMIPGKARSIGETDNPEAFKQYMLGRYLWRKRDEINIRKAIAAFQSAIDLDPSYARAHAGLADSYVLMNLLAYGKIRTKETMTKARAAAKEAIKIDSNNAEAHTSLGIISTRYDWNWQEAEREFTKAIETDPDYAPARYWYADLLAVTGRVDESVTQAEKAKELDPFSPLAEYNYARTLYYGRRYDEALEFLRGSEFASELKIRYLTGLTLLQKGMNEEALKVFEEISRENRMLAIAALGYTYGKLNRRSDARKLIEYLEKLPKEESTVSQEIAIILIGLGERDKALYYLKEVVEDRHGAVVALKVEPLFDMLRDDPNFAELLRMMALT